MASILLGRRLTEQQRLAQARLGTLTAVQMRQLWRMLDTRDLAKTASAWLDTAVRLVQQQYGVSSAIARRYFQAIRTIEVGAPLGGRLPEPAFNQRPTQIALMVSGPVRIERAIRNGEDLERAIGFAFAETAREAGRRVLDGGRDQLLASIGADRHALGYARATSGNACAFCELLSSRGPVYGEESADFEAHAGCSCTAEPVWDRETDWPPGAAEARDLYDQVAAGSSDPLNAFRRAVEGRTEEE